ncbi:bifunctional diguanylate cyclase/phosphodiesterase [Inhella gelatinilytica]|uniref:EAL domain-containing protein n=1 Tax=Inhella gelatinilytica TaxID=2795030 RepID=A0A931NEE6_9BURK|nr:LapD/MoxY N-terminal periplasmic domain-containing protein [Inhella gelatinilytica]MBH9553160.1 EAL domain-containing protein [Inhella gelatinilytica]
MSLIRQISLLIAVSLLVGLTGALGVSAGSLRTVLQDQARIKNADNAQALALAVSQQGGDVALIELLMSAQFDTGHYQALRWIQSDGKVGFTREAQAKPSQAPQWLQQALPLSVEPGVAQLSNGWQAIGQVEIKTHLSYAYDTLWAALVQAALWSSALTVVALLLAQWVLGRIRRPLDALVAQADAMAEGQFLTVPPAKVPELRSLTEALNATVGRIQRMFEAQTEQLGLLRQQAHCDALTGLSLRKHFLAELASAMARDDLPPRGAFMLLRLEDLAGVNRLLGREATDQVLALVGQALSQYCQRVPGSLAGRLNGADLALWLPAPDVLQDSAEALAEALRLALQQAAGQGGQGAIRLALGGVELAREQPLSYWFSQADEVLAQAEGRAVGQTLGMALRVADSAADDRALPSGERAWRAQIEAALAQGHTRLLQYPVLDREGHLLHWECPLHLGLAVGGGDAPPDFVNAQTWLPLALRTQLTADIDLAAVGLALQLTQGDGQMRALNIAPASLLAHDFLPRLRALLRSQPGAARQIALEFDVHAAHAKTADLLRELSRAVHPLGVSVGLEHAGAQVQQMERLYELGLDYIKLDRSVLLGVHEDASRAGFVRSLVLFLQGQALQVMGEGVDDARDAKTLIDCGLNGLTGPWATGARA